MAILAVAAFGFECRYHEADPNSGRIPLAHKSICMLNFPISQTMKQIEDEHPPAPILERCTVYPRVDKLCIHKCAVSDIL